jgi:hypothetical protein
MSPDNGPSRARRHNRLGVAGGQRNIQHYFGNNTINTINNVHVTINNHPTPVVPQSAPAGAAAGAPVGDVAPTSGEGDESGRAAPPSTNPPRSARRGSVSAPHSITVKQGGRYYFDAGLKHLVVNVVARRFPAAVHGRYSRAAEFLNTDSFFKTLFGPRVLPGGEPYSGILDSDVRRFLNQANQPGGGGGAITGRPPILGTEVRQLIHHRLLGAFGNRGDGVYMPANFRTVELVVLGVLDEARADGLPNAPPPSYRPSRSTIYRLLEEVKLVWRTSTSGTTLPVDFDVQALDYAARVAVVATTHGIPPDRIWNADQAGVCMVANSGNARTLAFRGEAGAIRVFGSGDKRQFTAMTMCNAAGDIGPPQVILAGKTARSLPSKEALKPLADVGGTATYTPNHWSNDATTREFIVDHAVPLLMRIERDKRRRAAQEKAVAAAVAAAARASIAAGTSEATAAAAAAVAAAAAAAPAAAVEFEEVTHANMPHHILIWDCWYGHTNKQLRGYVRATFPWLHILFIPANCTSKLQVCDLVVQRSFKAGVIDAFTASIREAYAAAMQAPDADVSVVVKNLLSIRFLRERVPAWVVAGVDAAQQQRDGIVRAWEKTLPHLTDRSFIATAHERVRERNLFKTAAPLDFQQEPQEAEDDDDAMPRHDNAAVARRLADALAAADAPMKRRRRDPDSGGAQNDDEVVEQETDEPSAAIHLDDDDDDDKFSDSEVGEEGMERFLEAADGDDARVADARALLAAARVTDNVEIRQRNKRVAAAVCSSIVTQLARQRRV